MGLLIEARASADQLAKLVVEALLLGVVYPLASCHLSARRAQLSSAVHLLAASKERGSQATQAVHVSPDSRCSP